MLLSKKSKMISKYIKKWWTCVDLSALYLRFDYKVEVSKEFEKQSLVCLPEFSMIWKWLGSFKTLKTFIQKSLKIFSWVLNIKHILKPISRGVGKENLFGFDLKSSF